jgi:acetyl-CoA carboxylase biotin carboxyl carrier protein
MADDPLHPNKPLDIKRVHYLVRLMRRYDLTALDVSDSSVQIRLRRRGPQGAGASTAPAPAATAHEPARASPSHAGSPAPAPAESMPTSVSAAPQTIVIESPMVGTFFSSSAPDSPPFVAVGSVVHSETIVCIIEAMKVFTDIPAGVSGTIAAILVKNGQPVEFGQPMFRLIPS